MKMSKIESRRMPAIDISVKQCINSGQWLLFKSDGGKQRFAYFLKTGAAIFGLDETGRIVEQLKATSEGVHIDELLYFSDMPQPLSLSNLAA